MKNEKVIVERMGNLGNWELYRFASEESDDVVCKVALRVGDGADVEYGVWRGEEKEPGVTGSLKRGEGEWGDRAREETLRRFSEMHKRALPALRGGVEIDIVEAVEDDEEDDDEEDDDEDEEGSE